MQGDKIFFFTCPLRVQGKKKTYGIVQNDTVYFFLLSFFFLFSSEMHETMSFLPKRAVSFKPKLAPKHVRFQISPSICVLFLFWSLVLDLFNQVLNWPLNFNIYAIKPLI